MPLSLRVSLSVYGGPTLLLLYLVLSLIADTAIASCLRRSLKRPFRLTSAGVRPSTLEVLLVLKPHSRVYD